MAKLSRTEPVIVIERRIRVAEIHHDETSPYTAIESAFLSAAQAMEDNLTRNGADNLVFTYGEHEFTLSAEPQTQVGTD